MREIEHRKGEGDLVGMAGLGVAVEDEGHRRYPSASRAWVGILRNGQVHIPSEANLCSRRYSKPAHERKLPTKRHQF